jgi:hypothetical protein
MSMACPARKPIGVEERLAWASLGLCVLALALYASLEPSPALYAAAAFGPEDLKAWGVAIAAFAASVGTAINLAIIGCKRFVAFVEWLRRPRRPRRKRKPRIDGPQAP